MLGLVMVTFSVPSGVCGVSSVPLATNTFSKRSESQMKKTYARKGSQLRQERGFTTRALLEFYHND